MSFSWDIKKKLCAAQTDCPYCRRSELAGIIGFSGDFTPEHLKLMTGHDMLAKRICDDFKDVIAYEPDVTGDKSKRILIEDETVLENLRSCLFIDDEQSEKEFESEILGLDCCRASYIRGAFLSGGCVLDPEKAYHLEFDTKYKKTAGRLMRVFQKMNYPVKQTSRKNHYLIYIKGYEYIADILGIMGADSGALTLYSVQVEKEMRNSINRQVNCDTANAKKLAAASSRQRAAIKLLREKNMFSALPDGLKELAELREKYPDESLSALGEMLSIPIGKSGVNHRMNKILDFALGADHSKKQDKNNF